MNELRATDTEIALRWRDLDHQGHVYHGAMVTLLDEARIEWLSSWMGPVGADGFVLVRLDVTFAAELRVADRSVRVAHTLRSLGTTSVALHEEMRSAADARIVASSDTVIVLWDAMAHAPRPLTDAERRSAGGLSGVSWQSRSAGEPKATSAYDVSERGDQS